MALDTERQAFSPAQAEAAQIDIGLRQYMLRVYNYMASGLALTGIAAYVVANTPAILDVFYQQTVRGLQPTLLGWIAVIAPIVLVFTMSSGVGRMRLSTLQTMFWAFAVLMGISLSTVLLVYTGVSVARVFFISAASFGALSLYGYTTKRDLTAFGRFLFIGLIGIVIAGVVNMFLASPGLYFVSSVIGVLIFAGLTAYDTQKIKEMYSSSYDGDTEGAVAIRGALALYLDFINLFLMLLRFMGDRRQ